MRHAAQCVGRAIRGKTDYGIMVFADKVNYAMFINVYIYVKQIYILLYLYKLCVEVFQSRQTK